MRFLGTLSTAIALLSFTGIQVQAQVPAQFVLGEVDGWRALTIDATAELQRIGVFLHPFNTKVST